MYEFTKQDNEIDTECHELRVEVTAENKVKKGTMLPLPNTTGFPVRKSSTLHVDHCILTVVNIRFIIPPTLLQAPEVLIVTFST